MPLKKAVKENRYEVAEFLIGSGMRPDSRKDMDLIYAALEHQSMPMLRLLLPFFELNEPEEDGRTPLFYPRLTREAAECLIQAGAKPDFADPDGVLPYQVTTDPETTQYLKELYFELHPVIENPPAEIEEQTSLDWSKRFTTARVSIADLMPVECDQATGEFKIQYEDRSYNTSDRFITSFARKLKFSSNIFNYFSAEEVFDRVQQRNPDVAFRVTFDQQKNEILGIVDENKKILPADVACNIFSADPRIQKIEYANGVWKAEFQLDKSFTVKNDSEYLRKIWVHYPVDGVNMPCVYLSVLRQICTNGATALVPGFRTDIEINDESGTHLSRLLRSYNNENGFIALESRLQAAQDTIASVNEVLTIENLLATQIADQSASSSLRARLEEMAGDPCSCYEISSLTNIAPKRRALLPVNCSVNDLFNFCSELTSHHDNIVSNADAFNATLGRMLSQEFDLEEMYHNRTPAKAFHLNDMAITENISQGSAARRNNTVLQA